MKRLLIGVAIFLILLGVGVSAYMYNASLQDTSPTGKPVTFPTASSSPQGSGSAGELTILGSKGEVIEVPNFIRADGTVPEPYTSGEYVLAEDCADTDACTGARNASGFRIVYSQDENLFNILLLAEPLRESRQRAEQSLAQLLQQTPEDLCVLKASVGTINSVNGTYADQELGFGACPGSVLLP